VAGRSAPEKDRLLEISLQSFIPAPVARKINGLDVLWWSVGNLLT
jgi:hypothetical protein